MPAPSLHHMGVPTQPIPRSLGAAPWPLLLYFPSPSEGEGQGQPHTWALHLWGLLYPASDSNILHSTHETNPAPIPRARGGTWSPKTQDTPEVRERPVSAPTLGDPGCSEPRQPVPLSSAPREAEF